MTVSQSDNPLRSGEKRQHLEEIIKNDIIDQRLIPGERLPSYDSMAEQYGVSKATYHFVIQQLKNDNYIHSIERQGTYVATHLPCLTRIGLIFESSEHENVFLTRLARESMAYRDDGGHQFQVFRGMGVGNAGGKLLEELRRHLTRRTLAGFCFVYNPVDPELRELLSEFSAFPYVLLNPYPGHPDAIILDMSSDSCAEKTVSLFQRHRRRNIALISKSDQPLAHSFVAHARAQGLHVPDEWVLAAPNDYLPITENLIRLLMSLPPERRPDGLYVVDDNLLTRVQSGLIKSGISVPGDLLLVCHANFPDDEASALPVEKVGFDVRDILKGSVAILQQWQKDNSRRPMRIGAKYEAEIV